MNRIYGQDFGHMECIQNYGMMCVRKCSLKRDQEGDVRLTLLWLLGKQFMMLRVDETEGTERRQNGLTMKY